MNRGSVMSFGDKLDYLSASMRPRFMNRGSVADVLRDRGTKVMLQ